MNSRPYINSCVNNSLAIRQEIQRFESVHPSIYAIYDLIELISDPIIAQQIRDHVVCIEDSFVNSQEWTVSRCVPDLRLGIVGSLSSGKSALVHRYLTGSYMHEESPEGGRFKKEVHMDGHSHLLLIRDEGGSPELQFTSWVDAVIFVFSLENEASFTAIYNYYAKMASFRNSSEIPLILVGTQDAISESNPRVIEDSRARKLASDLSGCSYYETCATYGLNVERVFQDACQKIVQQRMAQGFVMPGSNSLSSAPSISAHNFLVPSSASPQHSIKDSHDKVGVRTMDILIDKVGINDNAKLEPPLLDNLTLDTPGLPTPTSTPTTSRKNRRRSNLFTPSKKASTVSEDKNSGVGSGSKGAGSEVGSGRAIPIKQGYLYKRSSKTLNKEWKKKYVTLTDDGRITYHPSLHDYMTDVHGKEIPLRKVTVKVPGQKPRGTKTITQTNGTLEALSSITNYPSKDKKCADKVTLMSYEVLKEAGRNSRGYEESGVGLNTSLMNGFDPKSETPSVKKRHRRMKSNSVKNHDNEDADGYEFHIVSLDNKQWHFEANSYGEREEWLSAIENQILNSLQGVESTKGKLRLHSSLEAASLTSIRSEISGNNLCADCSEPNPDWASLNLGILLCIECSGIHRNLGSHISKVRSLHLDEWPPSHLAVMLSIGNQMANSIWECEVRETKPGPSSPREEKERWAYLKYQTKQMLRQTKADASHWQHQIIDATCREDMRGVVESLVHGPPEVVNATVSPTDPRTPLYLACSLGNLPLAQLLLWYNAELGVQDSDGQTILSVSKAAARSQPDSSLASNLVDLLTTLLPPEEPTKPVALESLPASVI